MNYKKKMGAIPIKRWLRDGFEILKNMWNNLILKFICFHNCQPTVIGTKSMPTGIPNLRYGEEGNTMHPRTAQLWHNAAVKTAQVWGICRARPLSGYTALLCTSLVCSLLLSVVICFVLHWCALLWWDIFGVSAQPGRYSLQYSVERKSVFPQPEGCWII